MKRIKLLIVSLMTVLVSFAAVAQNVKVTGKVTDDNGPLPGAAIMVQGTANGAITNADGTYSITVPSNATLVFTSVGYEDIIEPVNGRNTINVRMKISSELIEETVVIGYGSGQKITNLVGSVKTVKSESLSNAPSASALDMLQGQVAGLSVLTTGGVAGDNNVSMTLHGVGSLTSSTSPLFVIDGIPSSSRTIMAMNPNDILSISVLKDASATSIYGSRAANGVVYVTTKSGSYNEKATVTYRGQYGISTLADFTMYNNMMSGDELKDFWIRAGLYTYDQIQSTYTDHGYTANTKWHEYYQQFNNPQYQNDITIEGGGRRVAYMIAASQFHQRGNTIGNWYDRYTVRSNVQGHPTNWLKVGLNVNFSYDRRNNNGNWGDGSNAGGNNYLSGGLSMILNPLYPAIDPVTGSVYEKEFAVYAGAINPKYQDKNTKLDPDKKVNSTFDMDGNEYKGYGGAFFISEGNSMYTWRRKMYAGIYNENTYKMTSTDENVEYDPSLAGMAMYYYRYTYDKTVKDADGNTVKNEDGTDKVEKVTTTLASTDWNKGDYYVTKKSTIPPIYGGFGTTLRFRGFDLSANFSYQIGGYGYDGTYQTFMSSPTSSSTGTNYHADILKSWSATNQGSDIPRFQYEDRYTAGTSDRFLTKASYLNIENINFGYTLPASVLTKLHIQGLRIYAAAENVFYWSKRRGFDPRHTYNDTDLMNATTYSPMRSISAGINLTF